jgi:small multidrug resistance pump
VTFKEEKKMNNYYFSLALILITVVFNTIAQVLLKQGASQGPDVLSIFLNINTIGGLFLYGLSALLYIIVLSKLNLSFAYPLAIGLTLLATTFSGAIIFRETVNPIQWTGIGLILSGIFAIALEKFLKSVICY